MTHPFSPCNEQCTAPKGCFQECSYEFNRMHERHDQEPDDFICPEDITCEMQDTCNAFGVCYRQTQMKPTKTAWYKRILHLRNMIDDHQIWLVSGDIGDICIVDRWIELEIEPTPEQKLRMLCAEKWLKYVAQRKGLAAARAWFIGNNFDGYPAYVALRDDYFYLLEQSAKEFVGSEMT